MTNERQVAHIWTCDACDHSATVDDGGSGRPTSDKGWRQIVFGALHDKLGNLPSHDLCGDCSRSFALLLGNRLGDVGDMAQAWDEGYQRGLRDAEQDVTHHADNPYLTDPDTTGDAS